MNLIKKISLFFLYHQRNYDRILKGTAFKFNQNIDKINNLNLRYQGLCSFYKHNYYHTKLCFEILHEKGRLKAVEYDILAYIYARHNEKEKAISAWCNAINHKKNDWRAKKALEYIKNKGRDINFFDDLYFDQLIPGQPFYFPFKPVFWGLVLLLGLGIPGYYIRPLFTHFKFKPRHDQKSDINKVQLPDYNPNILQSSKKANEKYSLSENEIKKRFEKVKDFILEDRVVQAQVSINRLKLSNASNEVKMRLELLESYINEPDYALFKNQYNYEEVMRELSIYDKIYIKWKGRVVNRKEYKDKLTFDFVIGKEAMGIIDGVIPVTFHKAVIVKNNDVVTVFGRLLIKNENENEETANNQAVSIEGKYVIRENQ